jgi:hypothetical protein
VHVRIPIITETGPTRASETAEPRAQPPTRRTEDTTYRVPTATESSSSAEQRAGRATLATAGVIGLAGIWIAVFLISLFSPDLVSGSEQNHVPIAALLTWLWGLIASRSLAVTLVGERNRPGRLHDVWLLVAGVTVAWTAATVFAVFGPEIVTGSDPTHIPISALLAPIAAMVVTTTACQLFASIGSDRKTERGK